MPSRMNDGDHTEWLFSAPAGLTVAKVTYSRWLWKHDDDNLHPELRSVGTALEGCSIVFPASRCDIGLTEGGYTTIAGLSSPTLTVGVRCELISPATGCVADGGTVPATAAVLYDAVVTINDPTPPTIGGVSGSLLAGGWLRGAQSLAVDASDAAGVLEWSAQADGATVADSNPRVCDYTFAKPCPDLTAGPLSVNTAGLADGSHTITVDVLDTAKNKATSAPTIIQTDNTAPTAPQGLSAAGAAMSATKTISGSVPAGQFSPVTSADFAVCDAAGNGCGSAQSAAVSGSSFSFPVTVTEGTHVIRVWLADQAGNALAANAGSVTVVLTTPAKSEVTVSSRVSSGRPRRVLATVSARAPGPILLTIAIGDAHGHRVRLITRTVKLHNGRGTVTFHTTSAARHIAMRASYSGSPEWLAGSARRTVVLRATRR